VRLDRTHIAVRERSQLEILDVSLQLMARYAGPLFLAMALGAGPLMLLNHLLLGWMADVDLQSEFPLRYMWNVTLLTFLEAQLGSVFATAYLGAVVFDEQPKMRDVVVDVSRLFGRITVTQIIVRGVFLAWAIYGLLAVLDYGGDFHGFVEILLILGICGVAGLLRAMLPFMNEIVLLERSPLRGDSIASPTIRRRSHALHSPAMGELIGCWIGSAMLAVLLFLSVYGSALFLIGVFSNNWNQGPLVVQFWYPLSLWIVATYFTVVRFLSYLDLRIRQEGWEVQIAVQAQAAELKQKVTY